MADIAVPSRQDARTKTVTIEVSTTIDGEKVSEPFQTDLPCSLGDAVALEGEKEVFKRFINALVIYKQGQKRQEIAAARGEGKTRVKAKYLEDLGL